jgi:hypothetical protein
MAQITLNSTGVASNGSLVLQSNGTTTAVTVDAAQNVGVGVTPSAWSGVKALQVGSGACLVDFGSSNAIFGSNFYNDGANKYINTDSASFYQQNNGAHAWASAASGTAGNAITFTQAMTLDASGNLGVGTTSPANKLDVVASGDVAKFGNTKKLFVSTDSAGFGLFSAASQANTGIYASDTSNFIYFATSSAERARITSGGDLLVGCTASPTSNRTIGFAAISNSTGGIRLYQTANNSDWAITATSGSIVNFYSDNGALVYAGTISVNGIVTTYGSVSDYRLKENVQPMTGALEKVQALNPVTYTFKDGGQVSQGFIAHELQAVIPDAVTGTKDATREEQYEVTPAVKDADGNVVTEAVMGTRTVPAYQSVDTSFLVATLTAAIQEQQALITTLTDRITALEAK